MRVGDPVSHVDRRDSDSDLQCVIVWGLGRVDKEEEVDVAAIQAPLQDRSTRQYCSRGSARRPLVRLLCEMWGAERLAPH